MAIAAVLTVQDRSLTVDDVAVIRGTALTNFPELVEDLGGDARELAEAAQVRYDDIGRQDRFISLLDGIGLLELSAAALGTPDFGRRLAVRQSIEILGPVGLAGRNADTVGQAFLLFDKFMAAYSPAIRARLVPHLDPGLRRFEFCYELDSSPPQAQAVELSLGVTLQVLRSFLGPGYRPLVVHLPHPPCSAHQGYQGYFGCPPVFSEQVGGFTIRAADLQRSLPADRLAHQTALDYLSEVIGDRDATTTDLVCALVRQLLPTGAVGLADIARRVGLHPKTLQRRLAAEDTTFAELVDRTRRDTAQRLLLDTDTGLDQLCRQLGYAEQSVLTRSCRRWFAMTPSAYRAGRKG